MKDKGAVSLQGYYGQSIVKPPVWTWQVGLYLFIGGTAGMSGVIALASLVTGQSLALVRAALGVALAGAAISPILLIWDLGRPARFLNMLRVFKWRSAMSIGVWTLVLFSNFAAAAFLAVVAGAPGTLVFVLVAGTALTGAILATYTGVLLGVTAVPVWAAHHKLLPFHFGCAGLGAAAAVLELLGFRVAALNAIGLAVAAVETGLGIWLAVARSRTTAGGVDNTTAAWLLRSATLLTGVVPLVARLAGRIPLAGAAFLLGALCSRYGWISAGRSPAQRSPHGR
jgi:formate-dependent nitrite reductase membrane component NrfD